MTRGRPALCADGDCEDDPLRELVVIHDVRITINAKELLAIDPPLALSTKL